MPRLLTALVYPLLVLQRLRNIVRGRDPLRRTEPRAASLWIERQPAASDVTYFSESSPAEADLPSLAERVLAALARRFAPPRLQPKEKFSAAADREQGIPDEMYTLW